MRLRFFSAPLFMQILGLVLFTLIAAQVINLAVVFALPVPPASFAPTMAGAVEALRTGQPVAHGALTPRLLGGAPDWPQGADERLLAGRVACMIGVPADAVRVRIPRPPRALRAALPGSSPRVEAASASCDEGDVAMARMTRFFFSAARRQANGAWLAVDPPPPPRIGSVGRILSAQIGFSALLLVPFAFVFARRLARPISAFARAAERIGRNPNADIVAPGGTPEVETAARALNDMHLRIKRHVAERTDMLAAIAHDLRTPLMRLRFRVEASARDERAGMIRDIEEMSALIGAALAFARDESAPVERVPLRLDGLVATIVRDCAESGIDIAMEPGDPVLVSGDAMALRRLVMNLAGNAAAYGSKVRCGVKIEGGSAVVEVEDDGPGLPDEELERVFEPFYRADPSRGPGTGGVGLGLAVARTIAASHGGDVRLVNRDGGGLRAILSLPACPPNREWKR